MDDAIPRQAPLGVLFDDPALRASLLDFIESGKGVIGIHDAIATFVQWPVYDQWPEFGRMIGGTENGGHAWNGELTTMRVEDRDNPVNAAFGGKDFEIADQAFQLQEPAHRDRLDVLLSIDPEKSTKDESQDPPCSHQGHGLSHELDSQARTGPRVLSRARKQRAGLLEPRAAPASAGGHSIRAW